MDSARSVGPRPPHQPCRLQYIRTLPSQNPRIRGIPLHSWHGTPKTKFPISFPANLPRPSQPCGQQILPAPGGRHPFPSSYSERERAERCRDSRTRPFLYLSLKIPPGEPECGPRTIFRAPPRHAGTTVTQAWASTASRRRGGQWGERSCQRGRREPRLRFHIQSPRLHLSDLPAGARLLPAA